jgi:hypothetical protein
LQHNNVNTLSKVEEILGEKEEEEVFVKKVRD